MSAYIVATAIVFAACGMYIIHQNTVPNKMILALIGLFPFVYMATGMPAEGLVTHVLVGLAAFAASVVIFVWAGTSGGLLKLAAAMILWLPLDYLFPAFLTVTLSLGVAALLHVVSPKVSRLLLDRASPLMLLLTAGILALGMDYHHFPI